MDCENCAISTDDLVAVHRIYPAFGDTPARQVETIEWWCVSCATQYPNTLVDPQPDR